ncbi:MAG: hypothetical protein CMM42_04555 [Rhodospirillaceae bacterium]|nr:hypothetical protein [Rhodospirillaceae bacterium]
MKVGDYFSIEDIEFEGVPYEDRKQIEAVFNKEALSLLKFEKTNLRLGDSVLPSSMRIPMFGQNVDLDVRSRVLGISAYNARPVLVFDYAMLGQLSVGKRGASVSSAGYYCFDLTAGSSAYTYEEQSILSSTNEANLEIKRTQYFKALFPSDSASPISDFLNIKDGLNSPTASDSDPNLLRSKLANLKKLFDDGLISRDEYDVKRRALLEAY